MYVLYLGLQINNSEKGLDFCGGGRVRGRSSLFPTRRGVGFKDGMIFLSDCKIYLSKMQGNLYPF